jgi:homoserine kinase
MIDLVIEPQRAQLIPGFHDAKSVAIDHGALGFSISGSGPSVFAWTASKSSSEKVRAALLDVFAKHGLQADSWIAPVRCAGARVIA